MSEQTVTMRYRMSSRDEFYGGGVVNGARSITYMGDTADRLMAKVCGNVGRCCLVEKIRLYNPVFAGDYMEFIARVTKTEGIKSTFSAVLSKWLRFLRSRNLKVLLIC